jgi:hypothetical protein
MMGFKSSFTVELFYFLCTQKKHETKGTLCTRAWNDDKKEKGNLHYKIFIMNQKAE